MARISAQARQVYRGEMTAAKHATSPATRWRIWSAHTLSRNQIRGCTPATTARR